MRVIILLAVAFLCTQCKTMDQEISNFKVNKSVIEEKFPDSHVEPVRGYNDFFTVSNTKHVYRVKIKDFAISKIDTLRNFSNTVITTR